MLTILVSFIVVVVASRYTGMAFMPAWVGLGSFVYKWTQLCDVHGEKYGHASG